MNKRMSFVLVLGILFSAIPAEGMGRGRLGLSYDEGVELLHSGRAARKSRIKSRNVLIGMLGVAALSTAGYFIGKQFTSTGRYNRASNIVDGLKGSYSRTLGNNPTTQDQIFAELGAFKNTLKNSQNFSHLNVIRSLDSIDADLKKAESLLVAAKRSNGPQICERLSVQAQKMYAAVYAKFTKKPVEQVDEAKNHIELDGKIDALLAEVRAMQNKIASIYGDIELTPVFKQQLKEYEELRAQRSANTRSAVINFAIPTAVVIGSIAALGLTAGKVVSWLFPNGVIPVNNNHLIDVVRTAHLNNTEQRIAEGVNGLNRRIDGLYNIISRRQEAEALNASFQANARQQGF